MVRTNSITNNETVDVMNLDDLRKEIIDRLKDVDNENELLYLLYIVDQVAFGPVDMDNLTPKQERRLKEAEEQIKRGECFTEEESNAEIDKWLEEN